MPEKKDYSITPKFGKPLALLLAEKLSTVYPKLDSESYIKAIEEQCEGMTYTQRVMLHAEILHKHLPADFNTALNILMQIIGPENTRQTDMFTNWYWLLPIAKYVELYGLAHFEVSMNAISEITKRSTGEYAIRPFIRKDPGASLKQMNQWAQSENFHLRRLASEGLRPKLPWASKLDLFIENPKPVFQILEQLKEDDVKYVQKSVANHLTDYLKVNPEPTIHLLKAWKKSDHPNTQWIVKHATRKGDYGI